MSEMTTPIAETGRRADRCLHSLRRFRDENGCLQLAAGVPRSTLSTWPSSHSTRSKPRLIEDGPRGEVKLGSAEQPRGHEQRRVADAEAAAEQRLEQGSARAGDAHRHASPAARTCRRCGRYRLEAFPAEICRDLQTQAR